jgi:S1-C subfamily serine protease
MDEARGVLVLAVSATSVLRGQLQAQDVLLSFDGHDVATPADLTGQLPTSQLPAVVAVCIFRNQATTVLQLRLR